MRRWVVTCVLGLMLAVSLVSVDLPFEGFIYSALFRFRGPVVPNPDIVLLTWQSRHDPHETHTLPWLPLLQKWTRVASKYPPRAVGLDFEPGENAEELRKAAQGKFPIFAYQHHAEPEIDSAAIHLLDSPDALNSPSESPAREYLAPQAMDIQLLKSLVPEQVQALSQGPFHLINVAGPPKTYPRFSLEEVLRDESIAKGLAGKIVLVSPPPDHVHVEQITLPFYPRTGVTGADGTEIHANIIDSVLRNRSIRMPSKAWPMGITVVVTLASVLVLFGTTPVVGMFAVVLISALLVLISLAAMNSNVYLDILKPLLAIAFTYYFLIPYRLIVEYKGRWKYQQENKLLSEVETLKDNFMSLVSHNLKTPIARIEGHIETLLRRPTAPEEVRVELRSVLKSTEELNRFVSRILHLAKVEHPEYQIRVESRDINNIVETIADKFRALALERTITLETQLEPLFPVPVEGELIRESIANLVENAIKYSEPGTSVVISTSELKDWVRVSVADSGAGIAEEDRANIFSKFYRGASVKNKGIRGSGLGLYLVKYFVELHGGTIEYKPRPEGGSVFTISLLRK